jgi:hypothetical protein
MKSSLPILASIGLISSLALAELPVPLASATAVRDGKQILFKDGEKLIARYQAEPGPLPRADIPEVFTRGGYVQELRSPSGALVTDDFAIGHVHHHGVWTAWTKTEFEGRQPDFWNMGQKKGRMEFVSAEIADGKAVRAEMKAIDMLVSPEKTVLSESWTLTASASPNAHAIQLSSVWKTATDKPLNLPEYHYGGFGFRGHAAWNGEANCRVLTSDGVTDRVKANTQRAKWCWVGGVVDGKLAGVVLMDHPKNFRHPQPMRMHPKEPFFCYAPQQAGKMAIEPGKPYAMRYQAVAMDGEPNAQQIEALWKEFAEKPE